VNQLSLFSGASSFSSELSAWLLSDAVSAASDSPPSSAWLRLPRKIDFKL